MDSKDKTIYDSDEYYTDHSYDYSDEEDCICPITDEPKNYMVLKEEDIKQRQADDITEVSNVLEISKESACLLLCHYKWKPDLAKEEWISDEERVRKAVGILWNNEVTSGKSRDSKKPKINCGICFEKRYSNKATCLGCGHYFCDECWICYVTMAINDGPGCLLLRCPEPTCFAKVGKDVIDKFGLDCKDQAKYNGYLIRSYVENNSAIKWCPAPGCDYVVELHDGDSESGYDVVCGCSSGFCWNCSEEAHMPVDCETVSNWKLKNSSEAENTTWILAFTKPCPNCKCPIEKNLGCMHMSCKAPCNFQFCWLCLGKWPHPNGACNGYQESGFSLNKEDEKRENAKEYLEKYAHYYERWASNHKSRVKAIADLNEMQNDILEKLSEKFCQTEAQLKFTVEAWHQIVECRRVLKWTYAYGFYLPAQESTKKQLFEYLQGQAEAGLERLHQYAETELKKYLKPKEEEKLEGFNVFRTKLVDLTKVTRSYFENLVKALAYGLSDIDSQGETSKRNGNSSSLIIGAPTTKAHECKIGHAISARS